MIKVELDYNPYLNETNIKFNGNKPRINSMVEKHTSSKLQSWIEELPRIFHDEMNGYDFDLLFSGTNLEFKSLKESFFKANVSNDEVRLLHINKLESRSQKKERIANLLEWFKNNPNHKFDHDQFLKDNDETINERYHYVVLHTEINNVPKLESYAIELECILDINELGSVDLSETPILMCINEMVLKSLKEELKILFDRNDVRKDQLFFYIDNQLNMEYVRRMIIDLGIKNPNIIKTIDDDRIIQFFNINPITNNILEILAVLNNLYDDIKKQLNNDSATVENTNKDVHAKIDALDIDMLHIKEAINMLENRDVLYLDDKYQLLADNFEKKLSKWHSNKIKIHPNRDVEYYSSELSRNVFKWVREFNEELFNLEMNIKNKIFSELNEIYISGKNKTDYVTEIDLDLGNNSIYINEDLQYQLYQLKHEEAVVSDLWKFTQFFSGEETVQETVLQVFWLMSEWKDYIRLLITPMISYVKNNGIEKMVKYANLLSDDYENMLKRSLQEKINEKEALINQLSAEEKQLEIDFLWLNDFENQLRRIERE